MRCRAALWGCFFLLVPLSARAQSANDLADEAAEHERSLDFTRAEAGYRAAVAAEPSSRAARRARVRLEWLEARKVEGDYGALVVLETARRSR